MSVLAEEPGTAVAGNLALAVFINIFTQVIDIAVIVLGEVVQGDFGQLAFLIIFPVFYGKGFHRLAIDLKSFMNVGFGRAFDTFAFIFQDVLLEHSKREIGISYVAWV